MIERIVSALSYITMGLAGFVWLILGLFAGATLRTFTQYHIFQSIFISILFVLLSMLLGFMGDFLSIIPFVNKIVATITFLLNMPVFIHFSVIQLFTCTLVIYCAVTSFFGRYTYIPWVSDIIDQNIGR
jgi:uncharacterized membrane protein